MCGIAGYYSENNSFSVQELEDMTDVLKHRGPDNSDFYAANSVGLGHTRLSIIDLSSKANQPMHSRDNRYVITFNGEIYNYKDIGKELDIKFRSNSDTEVIIAAFEEWGISFINKLNGMFAIALYDKLEDKLFLYRDRIGIKPLYYFWDGKNFVFASEIKSILKIKSININKQLYKRAINEFLHLGYIPGPNTIYQNIFKMPAGHHAVLSGTNLHIEPFWKIERNIRQKIYTDEATAKKELKNLIYKSVESRLMSDVPFGTFLSGGIDSSIVTAVAQNISSTPINTFTIGFKEAKYNEKDHAADIAKYLKTNHHEFVVDQSDAMELVDDILTSFDEPFADASAIPTMLVSKMAKKHVSMVLSGDGGDEQFLGYGAYTWADRMANPLIHALRKPIGFGLSKMSNRYKRAAHIFEYQSKETLKSHIFSQEQYFFTTNEINEILNPMFRVPIKMCENYIDLARELSPVEAQAVFDLNYYLRDDLLVKVDKSGMKYSLETRVPLLDHKIVEFTLNLSEQLKIKDGETKYLLKQVLYDYVPKNYFNRPKWGFSIPLIKWLKEDLRYLIDKHLSEENITQFGIVNWKYVKKLKRQYLGGQDYLYNRIWLLIILHIWAKKSQEY